MKAAMVVFAFITAGLPLQAACGTESPVLRDWGLHREWRAQRDCLHPDRPAKLVETLWTEALRPSTSPLPAVKQRAPVVVQPGMRVRVVRKDAAGELEITGVAEQPGSEGQSVMVRAGLGRRALRCVVRGPQLVELEPQP